MRVPSRARTGFERGRVAGRARWSFRAEQRIDANRADEPLRRSVLDG
jgi:hypothetical protein